ncbi:MAG: hypothetical protein GEU92_01665 [Alphaproteobacteria bacterium]|nr:hypothetical protein [Alphaproteobacteria bacterium]
MTTSGRQDGRSGSGIRARIAPALSFLAALLMLHGAVPFLDGAGIGQLDPVFNRGGLAAAEPASLPSIQPRGAVPPVVHELRIVVAKQGLAPDRDAPSGLAADPATTPQPGAGEIWRPVAGGSRPPVAPHAFDARAPPRLA